MSDREDNREPGQSVDPDELTEHQGELLPERTAMSIIRAPGEPQIAPADGLDLVPPTGE